MTTLKLLKYFSLLLLILFLAQCSRTPELDSSVPDGDKEQNDSSDNYELAPNSFYATDEIINLLAQEATDTKLVFKKSQREKLPQVGQVWIFPISNLTPNGFLGRVVNVEETNDHIVVSTERVNIDNAFKTLTTSFYDDNFCEKIVAIQDANGENIDFELSHSSSTRLDFDSENRVFVKIPIGKVEQDGFTLEGKIEIALGLDFHMAINDFKLQNLKIELKPEMINSYECGFEISTKKEENGTEKEKFERVLKEWTLKTGPIPVGPITLFPEPKIRIVAGVKGDVSVKTTMEYKTGAVYTMLYTNNNWYYNSNFTPVNKDPLTNLSLDMNGEAYLGIAPGIFLGFYSPFLGVTLEGTGKVILESSFELDKIVPDEPGYWNAGISIWGGFDVSAKVTGKLFNIPVKEKEFLTSENRIMINSWSLMPILNWGVSGDPIGSLKLNLTDTGLLSRWCNMNIRGELINVFDPNEAILDEYIFENIDSTYLGKELIHVHSDLDAKYPYQWKCYIEFGNVKIPIDGASGHNNWDYELYMMGKWYQNNTEGKLSKRVSFNEDHTYTWTDFLDSENPNTRSGTWFCSGPNITLVSSDGSQSKYYLNHEKGFDKDVIAMTIALLTREK